MTAKTKCFNCGEAGHWAGDSACRRGGKGEGRGTGEKGGRPGVFLKRAGLVASTLQATIDGVESFSKVLGKRSRAAVLGTMGFLARATNEVVSAIRMPGMRTMFTPARTELERLQRRRIFNCCTTTELKEDCVREEMSNSSCNCCARDRSRCCDGDHVLGNRVLDECSSTQSGCGRRARRLACQSIGSDWARMVLLSPMEICDEVRFCRLDKTYKADHKRITLNIVDAEKPAHSRGTRPARGRARSRTSHSHGARARDISGGLTPRMRQPMKVFLADRGGAREQQAKERAQTAAAHEQRPRRRHEPYHEAR